MEEKSMRDEVIDAMFYCLPATGYRQLRIKASKRLGWQVRPWLLNHAIWYLRGHAAQYQWTIPHCRRGKNMEDNRLIRVLTDGTDTMIFDRDEDRLLLEMGALGTVRHTARMSRNEAVALNASAQFTRSRIYREHLEGLAEDFEALSKKAARVAKIIDLEIQKAA